MHKDLCKISKQSGFILEKKHYIAIIFEGGLKSSWAD